MTDFEEVKTGLLHTEDSNHLIRENSQHSNQNLLQTVENENPPQPNDSQIHTQPDDIIPPLTEYTITCKCCCGYEPCASITHKTQVDGREVTVNRKFWGSHELDAVGMNVFVSGLIIFVLLIHFFFIFPKLSREPSGDHAFNPSRVYAVQIPCLVLNLFFLTLFLWSYFSSACIDPGFLPFNWVLTKKSKYRWDEQLSGLAINESQQRFALHHRPKGASFSKASGRFVIRADHICGWIGNWVGKRNHKQFILMNFWGGLFALNLLFWHIPMATQIFPSSDNGEESSGFTVLPIVIFLEGSVEVIFGVLLLYVTIANLRDLRHDLTEIQKWKHEKGNNDFTFMQAMRQIFGNDCVCCWFCPTQAFDDDLEIEELPNEQVCVE